MQQQLWREGDDVKTSKYQRAYVAIGYSFMQAALESQGCKGESFLHRLDRLVIKRADQIGVPVDFH